MTMTRPWWIRKLNGCVQKWWMGSPIIPIHGRLQMNGVLRGSNTFPCGQDTLQSQHQPKSTNPGHPCLVCVDFIGENGWKLVGVKLSAVVPGPPEILRASTMKFPKHLAWYLVISSGIWYRYIHYPVYWGLLHIATIHELGIPMCASCVQILWKLVQGPQSARSSRYGPGHTWIGGPWATSS